jgi:hypothetical protein
VTRTIEFEEKKTGLRISQFFENYKDGELDTFDIEIVTRPDGAKWMVLMGADASGEEFAEITIGVREVRMLSDYLTRWADSINPPRAEPIRIPENLGLNHIYTEIRNLQTSDKHNAYEISVVNSLLRDIRGYLQQLETDSLNRR